MKKHYALKTFYLILLISLGRLSSANSQSVVNYFFSNETTGSLQLDKDGNAIDMSTGTIQLYGPNVTSYSPAIQNLGFTFLFMGTAWTQFSANPDGQFRFGSVNISGGSQNFTGLPYLLLVNSDNKTSPTGMVHYKRQGS
jgi:hypothetical protein